MRQYGSVCNEVCNAKLALIMNSILGWDCGGGLMIVEHNQEGHGPIEAIEYCLGVCEGCLLMVMRRILDNVSGWAC